jgi:hypothetical protein
MRSARSRKHRQATAARTAISFAGFTRESANVDFTQQLKNDSGGLEAGHEVAERPGQLGLQVQSIFGQY